MRKSAGNLRWPPVGCGLETGLPRGSPIAGRTIDTSVGGTARGSSTARGEEPTPNSAYERLNRVADHRERQIADVATQFLVGRVEYDDLADAGVGDVVVSMHDRLQVNVADWTAGETSKLQMDESMGIGNGTGLTTTPVA